MLFKNETGEKVSVRITVPKQGFDSYDWKVVRPDEEIDIPESQGKALGLTPVKAVESKAGTKTVETKVRRGRRRR